MNIYHAYIVNAFISEANINKASQFIMLLFTESKNKPVKNNYAIHHSPVN